MTITIDNDAYGDFERLAELEWLETNGLGGWAGSTVAGAHSRRYHGLLVAATRPPVGRTVMVSKLEETLRLGNSAFELDCNRLQQLPPQFGHGLHALKSLSLRNNRLRSLPRGIGNSQGLARTLTDLMLAENKLQQLPAENAHLPLQHLAPPQSLLKLHFLATGPAGV